jgi:two-component system, cell cycle response regulator
VDEDHASATTLSGMLNRWGYEVSVVNSGKAALDHLMTSSAGSQIVIANWMMSEMDGLELCKQLRTNPLMPYCFIVLLSVHSQSEDAVQGLDAGADDFLAKPYNPDELQSRIRAGMRILKLNQRLEDANRRLQIMADVLTGLMNRGAVLTVLYDELARAQRERIPLAVAMIDIDHFKELNDEYQHVAGDQILREFSQCLKLGLRTYDSVGRYGGEEFIIIMPHIPKQACQDAMERLRKEIEATTFLENSHKVKLTASFGVAWGIPDDKRQSEQFIRKADAKLYEVKEGTRNAVAFIEVGEEKSE